MLRAEKGFAGKILSLFLSLLIIALSAPMAFAAEPVVLTSANVVTWPTTSGEIFFGQKLSEGISLVSENALVTSDGTSSGTVIPGKWEFIDTEFAPTLAGNSSRANVKFTPDDGTNYTGFEITGSRDVTYKVNKTTPVFVDEINNPLVATDVEQGATLASSTLSGGQMMNPYNKATISKQWGWSKKTTTVTQSGEYEAKFVGGSGYNPITTMVSVRVIGDVPASEISVLPTIEFTYNPNITWKDFAFEGCKAVIEGTTTEVAGTFKVTSLWENVVPRVGSYEIDVTFTPDDETVALPIEFKCPVTVNKAAPSFKTDDESGIPTITLPYGTKLDSSLDYKLKAMVDVSVPVSFAYIDENGNDFSYKGTTPIVGTHEIQVKAHINDSNYEQYTMLTFKLEITGFTANCLMEPVGTQGYKILDSSLKYDAAKPKGTFTVQYTVNGEQQPDITVKYDELFNFEKTKSGKYEFSIKYNEIENDPFEIADFTFSSEEKLERIVKIGDSSMKYLYGDTVTAAAPAADPSKPDKPYYGFAGWEVKGSIGLSDEELKNPEISFIMPDEDVELNATYKFSLKLFFEWIWQRIVQFFSFIIYAVKDIFALMAA